ncbi:hypothetical protein ASZ90_017014 [hydrocarbon metagenome]|uniref:Uncharacterized protein n=1 Tax=hydrocarbon metagenome TaxID=938273 RepID=A0A0W8EAJ8_9ZZZZ
MLIIYEYPRGHPADGNSGNVEAVFGNYISPPHLIVSHEI